MINNTVIAEGSVPLPVSLSIRKQTGDRYQLTVYNTVEDETHETCFNFYGQESLNMRIDKKNLIVEIKKG
jgi:hypothetical protein